MNTRFIKFVSFLLLYPTDAYTGIPDREILKHKPAYLGMDAGRENDAIFIAGWRSAENDLLKGTPGYYVLGMPAPWAKEFIDICQARYGIQVHLSGCIITDEILFETAGYNECIKNNLKKIFGDFDEDTLWDEARSKYEKKSSPVRVDIK